MTEKLVIRKLGNAEKARVPEAQKLRDATTYTPVVPAKQLGFIHNNMDCIGCRACEIACKDKNGLAPGPRFRRVMYIEGGSYPDVFAYNNAMVQIKKTNLVHRPVWDELAIARSSVFRRAI